MAPVFRRAAVPVLMLRWAAIAVQLLAVTATGASSATGPVVVTGATGRTGSLLYHALQARGVTVRALVRNVTKAREILGCQRCDAGEGIFVGDVTKPETLVDVMAGAGSLAIMTSAIPICTKSSTGSQCHYPEGAYPKDIDFNGGKAQYEAFAEAQRKAGVAPGLVALCSSMGTTDPDSFLEKLGNGHIGFFKLNEEASLMSSGLPFTIVKPCGLVDTPPGHAELLVGHDDDLQVSPPVVARADVARVILEAIMQPLLASNLRFDLCSKASGTPTTDFGALFRAARFPWQTAAQPVVV